LLDGRYGPYVTDGTSNASLPRGTPPAELTFQQALDLLAERAARSPARRRTARKKTTKKKKTTTRKTTAKKAAKKKTAKKKTA
jgi:DNA topoisomerase-1